MARRARAGGAPNGDDGRTSAEPASRPSTLSGSRQTVRAAIAAGRCRYANPDTNTMQ